MNDIVWTKSYEDYKTEVGAELSKASDSFVRIGYLLKVARDTEVLNGTEFEGDYIRFAAKEFGLEKTQVSRFIRINDKFSIGGNSDELKEEFKGYGTRKLGIMLTLPDEIVEELSPELTVDEIETIQEEVKDEQKISPLEAYAETIEAEQYPKEHQAAALAEDDILGAAIFQILEDKTELFEELEKGKVEERKEIFSPAPDTMYITRVMGVGKLMLICKEEYVSIVNARTNEKQKFSWEDLEDAILYVMEKGCGGNTAENYEAIFGKPFPEKPQNDDFGSKMTENAQKKADKTKNEKKRVNVTKEKKNAEKERRQKTETEGHESAGNGAEERTEQSETMAAESDTAAEREVHNLQQEGTAGESQLSGETDLGGTKGESLPLGIGETLSGEDSGAAGGEGNATGTPERNKYSARLENLTWKNGMLIKEINAKDYEGALKSAGDIEQCIQAIISDLKNEEGQNWREV